MITSTGLEPLSSEEIDELTRTESAIELALQSFVMLGALLKHIRDSGLYRAKYRTFEEYCEGRWGIKRRRAYQYIEASDAADNHKGRHPLKESQARALARATRDPAEQRRILDLAVRQSEGRVTEKAINKAAEQFQAREKSASSMNGKVQHGTKFEPDAEEKKESKAKSKTPPHLVEVFEAAKEAKDIVYALQTLKGRLRKYARGPGGKWTDEQTFDRHMDQLTISIKHTLFETNCPNCKNAIKKTCVRCQGRGYIDHAHSLQNTESDKEWLASQGGD